MLSMAPQRTLRMSTLAELAEGSLPRLSQVVGRLEKRGWVRRTPDPEDGRYTLAVLTDQGWAKVARAAPGHVETVRRLVFDPLTKAQIRQLPDISRRIVRASTLTTPASPTSHLPPRLSVTHPGQPPGPGPPPHRRDRQHPQPEGCSPMRHHLPAAMRMRLMCPSYRILGRPRHRAGHRPGSGRAAGAGAGGERISSQADIRLDGRAVEAGSTPRTRDEAS
jgi:DNA-binding MarR family transcriptional regulator